MRPDYISHIRIVPGAWDAQDVTLHLDAWRVRLDTLFFLLMCVLQLSLLFQNELAWYGSEGIQICIVASYLTRRALGWFKAYHEEITLEIKFKTYIEFIRALKVAYNNPDKRATVERKLLALR